MLSFGIRFGQGFDRMSMMKLMQSMPLEPDFDVLVIGASPGGVACAKEARLAGKKTGIIKWQKLTPAEEEGFDEDLEEVAVALEVPEIGDKRFSGSMSFGESVQIRPSKKKLKPVFKSSSNASSLKSERRPRKVRHSRMDMSNEFYRRGQDGRKLMHNAAILRELIEDAGNCGWRVVNVTQPLTINWSKMMNRVMDYIMSENWKLATDLAQASIEVIEGTASFINPNTIRIKHLNAGERDVVADIICVAPSSEYFLPEDVLGADAYGITCDDFIRMDEPPGKTLVVGAQPDGLECAGIIAGCQFPVTVVSRSAILKGYDAEISQMIVEDLRHRGVVFLEKTALISVESTKDGRLLATFLHTEAKDGEERHAEKDEFDTVLFAVGKKTHVKEMNLENAGINFDPGTQKINANEMEETSAPNVYAVGDVVAYRPEGVEVSELAGKLLGRRLFQNGSQIMDYTMLPFVMFTPTEYAFVGISEETALYRFGAECIEVYRGSFRPLEFVVPPRKGQCFAKVVVLKSMDLVIGIHIFGPDAGEAIQGFAAALKAGMTMSKLHTVVGVPTTKAQTILKLEEPRTRETENEF